MGNIRCARCGRSEDEASASYGEEGLICARCLAGVKASDAAEMQAQVEFAARGLDGFLTIRHDTQETRGVGIESRSAAAAELSALGARVQRSRLEKSVQIGPKRAACDGYREVWTLPAPPKVQAHFTHENLDSMVVKIFRKELQTGDKTFDDVVYIRTDTKAATAAFLAREDIRNVLGPMVSRGGRLEIKGNVVEGEALWDVTEPGPRPEDLIAYVVRGLIEG